MLMLTLSIAFLVCLFILLFAFEFPAIWVPFTYCHLMMATQNDYIPNSWNRRSQTLRLKTHIISWKQARFWRSSIKTKENDESKNKFERIFRCSRIFSLSVLNFFYFLFFIFKRLCACCRMIFHWFRCEGLHALVNVYLLYSGWRT